MNVENKIKITYCVYDVCVYTYKHIYRHGNEE